MAKPEDTWSVEEIACADLALKRLGNAHEVSMAIDRLFFAQEEKAAILKLKEAGHVLVRIKEEMPEDLRPKWIASLNQQLRSSVDRAKKNAGKK